MLIEFKIIIDVNFWVFLIENFCIVLIEVERIFFKLGGIIILIRLLVFMNSRNGLENKILFVFFLWNNKNRCIIFLILCFIYYD